MNHKVDGSIEQRLTNSEQPQGARYARRSHYLRTIGFGASSLSTTAVEVLEHAHLHLVVISIILCLTWPPIALYFTNRSRTPLIGERRSLIIDGAVGGLLVAMMQFAPVPSFAAFLIFAMNSVAGGGLRILLEATLAMAAGSSTGFFVMGRALFEGAPLTGVAWWLPLLTIYTLMVAHLAYQMAVGLADRSRRLRDISRRDPLTGLLNRRALFEEVSAELQRSGESSGAVTLFYLDLDGFKLVNDTHGHLAGDTLLIEMSKRIMSTAKDCAAVGRLGGDEFAILATRLTPENREAIASQLLIELSRPVAIEDYAVEVRCSIGISCSSSDSRDALILMQRADAALYIAKRAGRNRFEVYADGNSQQQKVRDLDRPNSVAHKATVSQ